jgi:hypothetical protein
MPLVSEVMTINTDLVSRRDEEDEGWTDSVTNHSHMARFDHVEPSSRTMLRGIIAAGPILHPPRVTVETLPTEQAIVPANLQFLPVSAGRFTSADTVAHQYRNFCESRNPRIQVIRNYTSDIPASTWVAFSQHPYLARNTTSLYIHEQTDAVQDQVRVSEDEHAPSNTAYHPQSNIGFQLGANQQLELPESSEEQYLRALVHFQDILIRKDEKEPHLLVHRRYVEQLETSDEDARSESEDSWECGSLSRFEAFQTKKSPVIAQLDGTFETDTTLLGSQQYSAVPGSSLSGRLVPEVESESATSQSQHQQRARNNASHAPSKELSFHSRGWSLVRQPNISLAVMIRGGFFWWPARKRALKAHMPVPWKALAIKNKADDHPCMVFAPNRTKNLEGHVWAFSVRR